ncbi:MAG: hypothetical protein ACRD3B_02560 [Candidatus Sulfotelmatobacter sp.]
MLRALKTLRAVQWAMLGSILVYAALGEFVRPAARVLDPGLSYLFTTLGVAIVGVIFVVRRTLVFRAEETLATQPDELLNLNQWKTGFIATYALCETLALFGLIERFLGCTAQQSVPYYLGGFVLMLFFRPRQPQATPRS